MDTSFLSSLPPCTLFDFSNHGVMVILAEVFVFVVCVRLAVNMQYYYPVFYCEIQCCTVTRR